ncbi:uncharacterized protein EI97DRAFT_415284 [Westerdykella ornata]|uniref:MACPF domain-containing protein n=1 Tax=Westerdykella ornata TaxID=318751 RepID=A0A6A6JN99_WESOR|nr:uncharacterized protein EI97DRAFT_415284 [Westerdykella ornata]KAF2277724.1 hypothetical protein EI97DRAFT_415284 [Westerdykella ornata]
MISPAELADPRNPHTSDPTVPTCPPLSWLGWGLDVTSITPCDISSVTANLLKASRFLDIKTTTQQQSFNSGVTWAIPTNVDATDDVSEGEASLNLFDSGTQAASSITADASLSAKYMAVTVGVSANYSISKMFQGFYSYALFSYNQNLIQASIDSWADNIHEDNLKKRLSTLPTWDPTNDDTVGRYKRFFRSFGTHIITGTSYGGRFQLVPQYNGLTNSGDFNASVKTSSEYSDFSGSSQKIVSCKGGDSTLAGTIASSPENKDIYSSFQQWVKSSLGAPAIMAMQTVAIWDMMSAAIDDTIVNRAGEMENAFKYIVSHPAEHVSKCRFVINSDWGEFGLLTPAAVIKPDPSNPAPSGFLISTTKVSWGRERSFQFSRDVTVDFEIHNDGSPVDIMLSHGSDGSTPGNGECAVTIYQTTFENAGVKDNNWNSQWFYKCDVNPNEV